MKQFKDKEWLSHKYIEEGLSLHQIGKMCGVDAKNIQYWMNKFELPTRSKEEGSSKYFTDNKKIHRNTCESCSKTFTVENLSQTRPETKAFVKFCSDNCRASARANRKRTYERECPCCGETFECSIKSMTDPSSWKFKKYCSQKCVLSSRNQANTWIEREIAAALDANEIDYIPQFELGRMTIDFVIPSKMIAIEANGDFWHANPAIYGKTKPLHKTHARVIEKDIRKLTQLDTAGYSVYVVWENDLSTNKDETLRAMISEILSA